MEEQTLIREIARKEIKHGCYDAQIDGLSVYSFLRYLIRKEIIELNGTPTLEAKSRINKKIAIISAFCSLGHLTRLWFCRKKYSTVFYSFPRVDKIGDHYMDKFTDSLIEEVDFKDNYIILDHGRGGVHIKPRLHSKKIVYLDSLSAFARLYSTFNWHSCYIKNKDCFDNLVFSLKDAFGLTISYKRLAKMYCSSYTYSKGLGGIFRIISAKRVIGPARAYLIYPFYAAHRLGIETFELQHGISLGETQMYSGFRDPICMPDFFLAFGNNKPLNVYGIDESKIVNIGWALDSYIRKIPAKESYQPNDVLVISDPEITDKIITVALQLADANLNSIFYIRSHPHEVLNEKQLTLIKSKGNVRIQDKSINISIVLQGFSHVIGEDSTVLYEALAVNKKVGKLFMGGLESHYLEDSDRECFWEIHNLSDFDTFLRGKVSDKKSKCIYSPFNKELFCKTLGL